MQDRPTTSAAEGEQECRNRIEQVSATGGKVLTLANLRFNSIPNNLASLTSLQQLSLGACSGVVDLAPLASLTALQALDLGGCSGVVDLAPLASLTALKELNLGGCSGVTDLAPLASLTALKSLNLSGGCSGVVDLAPLASLTALQALDLGGCSGVVDLAPLASLTALKELNLGGCSGVTDLAPLASLTALKSLNLSGGCSGVVDLVPLASLTALQELYLDGCSGVTDLAPLASPTTLQVLYLGACSGVVDLVPLASLTALQELYLDGCSGVTDLAPLASLTTLKSLHLIACSGVVGLAPLASLTALKELHLEGCSGVTDLAPLASLTALQSLSLRACPGVTDLAPLASLTALQELTLWDCSGVTKLGALASLPAITDLCVSRCLGIRSFGVLRELLPKIKHLNLCACQFDDVYEQICGTDLDENVLDKIIDHFNDIDRESAEDAEIKLFVLGNGRVGKTQLCRRLMNKDFQPESSPTHGINLDSFKLPIKGRSRHVSVRFWDFGGQDIFLGTHSLFLQKKHAVFVLVWTPEYEQNHSNAEGDPIVNRPLGYWLDYLRATVGTDCPVLVVRGQCDKAKRLRKSIPPVANGDFPKLIYLNYSAKTDVGLADLVKALKNAVQNLLARPFHRIGTGRLRVRKCVRALQRGRGDRRKRTITVKEFHELCDERRYLGDKDILLGFLHVTGVLFYKDGLFKNQIILDQRWALKAIYSIFAPKRDVRELLERGRFTRTILEQLLWRKHSLKEQEAFLGMMLDCGICFQVAEKRKAEGKAESVYLAPDLLPDSSKSAVREVALMARETATARVTLYYRYLHDGILRTWMARIGGITHSVAEHWRYGCLLWSQTKQSKLLMESDWSSASTELHAGEITFSAWGSEADNIIDRILEIEKKLPFPYRPKALRSAMQSTESKQDAHRSEGEGDDYSPILEPNGWPEFARFLGIEKNKLQKPLKALALIGDDCEKTGKPEFLQKHIAKLLCVSPAAVSGYLQQLQVHFDRYFTEKRGLDPDALFDGHRVRLVTPRGRMAYKEAMAYRDWLEGKLPDKKNRKA